MFILNAVVSCGGISNIPIVFPNLVSTLINIIKIAVPILLIIFGMIDLGKAVTGGKEEDIKKGQAILIKRIIAAVTVFLIISIVQLVFSLLASATGDSSNNLSNCISCFTNGTVKDGSTYKCK
jgi:hypothetical protein